MTKRKRAMAEPAPLSSPGSVGQIDLEGPSEATLTPPPQRRTGLIVALTLGALTGGTMISLARVYPEFFVTAVQAFVGGI